MLAETGCLLVTDDRTYCEHIPHYSQVLHMGKSLIQGLDEIIHGGGEGADNGGGSRAKAQQWEAELQVRGCARGERCDGSAATVAATATLAYAGRLQVSRSK